MDITANRHGGNAYSMAAHLKAQHGVEDACIKYLGFVIEHGDATNDEVDAAGVMRVNSGSARRTEMLKDGRLELTGESRVTRSGSKAGVVRATNYGIAWYYVRLERGE